MRKLIVLFAMVFLFACSKKAETPLAQKSSKAPAAVKSEPAPMMPDFTAKNLDGTSFDLKTKRGRIVLLNLWATWCGPCRHEIPELEKLHAKYTAQNFEVIGVSLDESGAEAVNAFLKEQPIHYPIVLDPDGKLANVLNVSVLPTSALIDRQGRIVWRSVGIVSLSDQKMIEAIEAALKS